MERLKIEIGPSAYFCGLCLMIHVLAGVALWVSNLYWLMAAGLGLALVASAAWHIRRYGLLADAGSVVALDCHDDTWSLRLADGRRVPARLENTVVLTRYLVVMNFRGDRKTRYPVALLPDSTSEEEFRAVRVCLRLGPVKPR